MIDSHKGRRDVSSIGKVICVSPGNADHASVRFWNDQAKAEIYRVPGTASKPDRGYLHGTDAGFGLIGYTLAGAENGTEKISWFRARG